MLRQTPKFRDYVADYFAHYAEAKSEKRLSTLATERAHLNAWMEHLGEVRLHRITPKMVDRFLARRQAEGISPQTVNLAVTCLRNVLERARREELLKSLPTESRKPLKYKPRERPGFIQSQVESICQAAFRPVFAGGRLVREGEPGAPLKKGKRPSNVSCCSGRYANWRGQRAASQHCPQSCGGAAAPNQCSPARPS